jgi:hypothetical protein
MRGFELSHNIVDDSFSRISDKNGDCLVSVILPRLAFMYNLFMYIINYIRNKFYGLSRKFKKLF